MPAVTPTINDSLLSSSVSNILGLQAQQATDTANATADQFKISAATAQSQGYTAEAGAYGTASSIAGVAGNITELQTARQVAGTIGAQQAGVAAAGFKNAGSSVDLLRSSMQQGYLQQQILQTQTAQEQQAYLAQGIGANAAANAATAAANAAAAEGAAFTQAGQLAAGYAASETSALQTALSGTSLTPGQSLILSPVSGDTSTGAAFGVAQGGPGQATGAIHNITYSDPSKTSGSYTDATGVIRSFGPANYSANSLYGNFYENINGVTVSVSPPS